MSLPTFFHTQLSDGDQEIFLSADESMHANRVRRLRVGDPVVVINGTGGRAQAVVLESSKAKVALTIEAFEQLIEPPRLTIAAAIPKGDRARYMIDMFAQLGVKKFVPLMCEFSNTKVSDKVIDKWRRVVIEASKQSQNPYLLDIADPLRPSDWLEVCQDELYVLDADGALNLNQVGAIKSACLLIGPEGGFSPKEFALFAQREIQRIAIAKNILRVETAAVSGAALLIQQMLAGLQDSN